MLVVFQPMEYLAASPPLMGGMALQLFSIATQLCGPAGFVRQADPALQSSELAERVLSAELSDVLFEQPRLLDSVCGSGADSPGTSDGCSAGDIPLTGNGRGLVFEERR